MRVLIAGAGAIGGYLGARMARAGQDVVLFARGPHMRAMQERGLRVLEGDGGFEVRPQLIGSLAEAGEVDVIFLGVKAHGLTALAPQLTALIRPITVVVSTQNGVPWWYFQGDAGSATGIHLERIDPGGAIGRAIPYRQVVASIAYFAAEIVEPGVIRLLEGNRLSVGEPDGSKSERCQLLASQLIAAGIRAPISARIRTEIWVKIFGNVAFNPISALTRATLARMAGDPALVPVLRALMAEVEAVAGKLGIEMPISIDQRIAGALKVGEHKTSMLQDLEAGRPLELETVVGAVVELGEKLQVPMPVTRTVYTCTRLLELGISASQHAAGPHNQ